MSLKRTHARSMKILVLAGGALLLPAAMPVARADCLDQPLICRAPLYQPLIYLGGCAIAGDLEAAGMCWSWVAFGCIPCDGDSAQCNALNPTECMNACEAMTGLAYYDACDGVPGGRSARMTRVPAAQAAPAALPQGVTPVRWVGTITPRGGRPRQLTAFTWTLDQPHLRIEMGDREVWAHKVRLRDNRISFTFFDNGEANCELARANGGAYFGTCVEPEAGTAHMRIRREP
jgi:hypothetical protein